ncbi:MAG TPA: phosphotransferase [Nitrospiria bacterium]|nr:phosphotransferase [Nitrospiria bacterium]
MPDRETVLTILKTKLGHDTASNFAINALPGDASNRSYYRLRYTNRGRPDTMILMELAEPEAFKKSEEAVSASTIRIDEIPYINILRHLARSDIAVPKLFYYDSKAGLLFLEDLGDQTLEKELNARTAEEIQQYYRLAIDELLKIQGPATRDHDRNCMAFARAFDVPLLMWEFDHFLEYGIEARTGTSIHPGDRETMRGEFLKISETLAKEPRFITHRDYHSRNLMVHRDRIRLLDFQDALMGPSVYDLASLLRDSYAVLPERMLDDLIDYYLEQRPKWIGEGPEKQDWKLFRKRFDLMSIQRNLKAAGRFVYIDVVKKKAHLLPYIPQTLAYVRHNLNRYEELKTLKDVLQPYVVEFQ